MTWHHGDRLGSLKLVDRRDHKNFSKIYHPNGAGGRNKWGDGTSYCKSCL
ncbi:MAG: HNH endonuclease [Azoarcus sp.]|nr:HNH endonuclease [Azoarcus sp.]